MTLVVRYQQNNITNITIQLAIPDQNITQQKRDNNDNN